MVTSTELIVAFVNTAEQDEDRDDLRTPAGLAAWLHEQRLLEPDVGVSEPERVRAVAVREAIRDLFAAHNEVEVDEAAAAAVLDAAARRADLCLHFDATGARLEPSAGGVDGAVGRVLAAVAGTMGDPDTWSRLKACRDETCRWAFFDTAKNRSRAWCSMRSCGNRAKVRAYRERKGTA